MLAHNKLFALFEKQAYKFTVHTNKYIYLIIGLIYYSTVLDVAKKK